MSFTNSPSAQFGGLEIKEKTIYGATDRDLLNQVLHNLGSWEKAAPTRSQVARACKFAWPSAAVFTGGHHVAVHLTGHDRSFIITGSTADWN